MKILENQRDANEWQDFIDLLKVAVKEDRLDEFFSCFLSPDERESMGLRLRIVQALLKNDCSQREIQQKLNTSAATITRGSNMLKTLNPDFLVWINENLNGKA